MLGWTLDKHFYCMGDNYLVFMQVQGQDHRSPAAENQIAKHPLDFLFFYPDLGGVLAAGESAPHEVRRRELNLLLIINRECEADLPF